MYLHIYFYIHAYIWTRSAVCAVQTQGVASKESFQKRKTDKETFFNTEPLMRCSECRALLHHSKFDETMKDNWTSVEDAVSYTHLTLPTIYSV